MILGCLVSVLSVGIVFQRIEVCSGRIGAGPLEFW